MVNVAEVIGSALAVPPPNISIIEAAIAVFFIFTDSSY
jgi:hypothetical protein